MYYEVNWYSLLTLCVTPQLLLALDMSMVIADSDMVVRQVSPGQIWCLIFWVMSVWRSPLHYMSVCPFLTLERDTIGLSKWFIFVHLITLYWCCYTCHIYSKLRGLDSWVYKSLLIHLSLVHSSGSSEVMCMVYQYLILHSLIDPLLAFWFDCIFFSNVFFVCYSVPIISYIMVLLVSMLVTTITLYMTLLYSYSLNIALLDGNVDQFRKSQITRGRKYHIFIMSFLS